MRSYELHTYSTQDTGGCLGRKGSRKLNWNAEIAMGKSSPFRLMKLLDLGRS